MALLIALTLAPTAGAQQRPRQPAPPPLPKQPAATNPAVASPYEKLPARDQELVRMVQLQVTQQIEHIRTGQARQRDRAQTTVLLLHRQLLVPLDGGRNRGISPRDAKRILADWSREIQLARLGTELGPDAAGQFRKLRDAKPDILERLISDDPRTQSEGLQLLQQWPDPSQLAGPLVLRILRDMNPEHISRIVALFQRDRYISPDALDGLLACNDQAHPALRQQILQVLDKFEDPRLPPILLQAMLAHRYVTIADPVAAGLKKHNALGAIPVLMDSLRDDAPVSPNGRIDNQAVTSSANDSLLYGVLKMTDQRPGDYGLMTRIVNGRVMAIGFATGQAREAAIEKLRAWWAQHRDKPPYSDAEPITPQPLPQPTNTPPGAPTNGPAILIRTE